MSATYGEHLNRIAAVWGADRVGDALDLALEAGKAALTVEQITPLLRAWSWLDIAGALPDFEHGESFYRWSRRLNLIDEATWEEARRVDLLGMRPDEPCPAINPADTARTCIRELHHTGRHIDEEAWTWE